MRAARLSPSGFTPLAEIIADLIPQLGEPLAELKAPTDPEADRVIDAWRVYTREVPVVSVLAACRQLVDDAVLIRLVNRLGWEGVLAEYARGDRFLQLVRYFAKEAR